ncbi:MAG: hypothetical protein CUN55_11170 [Phototrophicales bacterium]|nr:MAG: hypothetical protein CUN55_11170 [Phototrophicales bacterium]
MAEMVTILLAVTVGFLSGVLVNAFADALPRFRQPRLPYYSDGSPRPIFEWSGIVAYFRGGRDKYDKTPLQPQSLERPDGTVVMLEPIPHARITIRHVIVEIFMALFFGFIVINWPNHDRTWIWFIYLTILMLITVIDIEHYIILTPVIVYGCLFAIFVAIFFPEEGIRTTQDYFIGGALGFGVFLFMYWGGALFSGLVGAARGEALDEVAFGFGDVMLATLCGLMIGWQSLIFALLITVFIGALGAVLFVIGRMFTSDKYALFTPLPYGPYIVIGTVIMMLWREDVRRILGGD